MLAPACAEARAGAVSPMQQMERCGRDPAPAGFKQNPMKTCRLLAAASAALTLCVSTSAFADEDCVPSSNGDCVYDGKMPALADRQKGASERDRTHMVPSTVVKSGRVEIIATVDQGKNNKGQIDVTFSE